MTDTAIVTKSGRINRRAFLCAAAGAWAVAAHGQQKPTTPTREIALFNGRDLTGLYTWLRTTRYEDPKKVFSVRDGLLRISGEDWGGIATREAYRDYHLTLEWKWGPLVFEPRLKNARDSGILLHCVGADGARGGTWMESIECQIIEGGCGDFILVEGANRPSMTVECRVGPDGQHYWQKGGAPVAKDRGRFNWYGRDVEWKDVLGFRGRAEVEKPAGEWNVSEAICDGSSVTNLVNGVVVNHGASASHTQGKIMLQSEGAEILIRRFELAPVRKPAAARARRF
ncbi:MAG: DUF1080 domain-containing protein [Acidobacteria bacterium]|nr:DUF1080 domain-containing protein [Acidobacteriota bacterium]